jgi:hypothetical protein
MFVMQTFSGFNALQLRQSLVTSGTQTNKATGTRVVCPFVANEVGKAQSVL